MERMELLAGHAIRIDGVGGSVIIKADQDGNLFLSHVEDGDVTPFIAAADMDWSGEVLP